MPVIQGTCSCGSPIPIRVGQYGGGTRLRWSESYSCAKCSTQIEADGIGIPGEEARSALLLEGGHWSVNATDSASRVRIAMAIRQLFGLSMDEAHKILAAIPGDLFTGTRIEMEWLSRQINTACGPVTTVVEGNGGRLFEEVADRLH